MEEIGRKRVESKKSEPYQTCGHPGREGRGYREEAQPTEVLEPLAHPYLGLAGGGSSGS